MLFLQTDERQECLNVLGFALERPCFFKLQCAHRLIEHLAEFDTSFKLQKGKDTAHQFFQIKTCQIKTGSSFYTSLFPIMLRDRCDVP